MAGLQDFYLKVRSKENRVYTDTQVACLPEIDKKHEHYGEWEVRKKSAQKLSAYISSKNKPLKILEIGCGNGWLAAKLSEIEGTQVTGWDVNEIELEQAKRVFADRKNLEFFTTSLMDIENPVERFDLVVFAASVQYFPSFKDLIKRVKMLLNQDGEIHIIDSVFYNSAEIAAARKRSEEYFNSMQVPEMAGFYFHHSIESLREFEHKIIYDPTTFWNRLIRKKNPFYWINIEP